MVKRNLEEDVDGLQTASKIAKVAEDGETGWTVTRGPQLIEINGRSCQHEVAWPGIVDEEGAFQPPAKSKLPPAKQYHFSLDPFQQTAINCLEAGKLCLNFSPQDTALHGNLSYAGGNWFTGGNHTLLIQILCKQATQS